MNGAPLLRDEHNGLYRSCGSKEIGKVSVAEYADTRKSTLVMSIESSESYDFEKENLMRNVMLILIANLDHIMKKVSPHICEKGREKERENLTFYFLIENFYFLIENYLA